MPSGDVIGQTVLLENEEKKKREAASVSKLKIISSIYIVPFPNTRHFTE